MTDSKQHSKEIETIRAELLVAACGYRRKGDALDALDVLEERLKLLQAENQELKAQAEQVDFE